MTDKLTNIALSGDDFDAFSKALDNPSEPNEALKSLFAGHIADLLERCGERIGGGEPNTFTDEIYDAVDRLRAFSAARNTVDRDASQVREGPQQSSDKPTMSARDVMRAGGVDPDAPFEVGPFPPEMRMRPPQQTSDMVARVARAVEDAPFDAWSIAEAALEASHHAQLVRVLHELVYGGGGHVWTHARELLAKIEGGQ